jgi:hypothetical protein
MTYDFGDQVIKGTAASFLSLRSLHLSIVGCHVTSGLQNGPGGKDLGGFLHDSGPTPVFR